MLVSRVLVSLRAYNQKMRKIKRKNRNSYFTDKSLMEDSFSSDQLESERFESHSSENEDDNYSEIPFNPLPENVRCLSGFLIS
jgi:hypothetical protein